MNKQKTTENVFLHRVMSVLAWIACLLLIAVLLMGDKISQQLIVLYPDWSFPAFFIPWFLLVISSVQKLPKNTAKMALQSCVLKTTVPIFVFTLPFFSQFLLSSEAKITCIDGCIEGSESFIGNGMYAVYISILVLFALHFLPIFNRKNESD